MRNEHGFYLDLAHRVAKQSYANRTQVGAVIVKDNNILSFGYNGTPSGFDNSCEEIINVTITDEHEAQPNTVTKPSVIHAEINAVCKCAKTGISTMGATMYLTHSPCIECAKVIIQSGISSVIYAGEYRLKEGIELLIEAGIKVNQL